MATGRSIRALGILTMHRKRSLAIFIPQPHTIVMENQAVKLAKSLESALETRRLIEEGRDFFLVTKTPKKGHNSGGKKKTPS